MKCKELLQYLSDYIDQNLDETLTAVAPRTKLLRGSFYQLDRVNFNIMGKD